MAENWRKWEHKFNLYLTASALVEKSESRQIAVRLHCIGEEALDIYNSLVIEYENPQRKKLSEVLAAFRTYCARERTLSLNDINFGHTYFLSKQA